MDVRELLKSALEETGSSLNTSLENAQVYIAQRTAQLALAVGQPGFEEAVRAERDNVAIELGLQTVAQADAADARVVGVIQGVLFAGAKVIAGGAA